MRKLELTLQQIEQISMLMETDQLGERFYYDVVTGEIDTKGPDDYEWEEEEEGEFAEDDAREVDEEDEELHPEERYLQIPERSSRDGYERMEDFAYSIGAGPVREALLRALEGRKGVFRRFKDKLVDYPEVQQQWYAYEEEKNREAVIEWLESEGFEVTVVAQKRR
ncbi:hypothetical protein PM3016_6687 [Paenibacillus mucilaginosus 3016]|uniref:Uncharacterized protein n=1 Tax=Paenibacillus mucilaginosus 3016 TaxID=1116391 RepID=H6NMD3_9BACL|nr:UPF0158 family protein [Paenibacillus mucilaginosus]AFC33295.1 hypothetical protein PM3016_6687 [Paenibacillus mucilaginosus 3016]WFA21712.1 hypothetical protein ERY13_33200 [Paenibacillus mucilaginosus]